MFTIFLAKVPLIVFGLLQAFGFGWSFPISPDRSSNRRILTLTGGLNGRRENGDNYFDNYYETNGYTDKEVNADDAYWSESSKRDSEKRGGIYKVYFDGELDPVKETQIDWEACSDGKLEALVLLPPAAVERPTAVLHFVGGTFFGSAPKLWYRTFLEGLVRHTQCAIVVTPIPVTLLKSPLQHIELTQKLMRALDYAWVSVLEDEYGDNLSGVPVCGMGHSLGARLLVVLATLTKNKPRGPVPPYKSFALISFTNFGASAGIPGVSTLMRQSKKQEKVQQIKKERQQRKEAQRNRRWVDDEYAYDDGDDVDGEWDELMDDLQGMFQEQASRVKTALTPKSEDLEFFPSPDMLWKALKEDRRYGIPETLVVQFDDDQVDQSSKLARILQDTNSSAVKFARLRGTHLSPIAITEDEYEGWLEFPSRASKTVWKAIKGRSKTKSQEEAMRDLRQSVARYITDVVTK